jgi:multidrug efflux pump subunit AcrB
LSRATFIATLISSGLAFIYIIVILAYLFKGRQDGTFMYPLKIFGIIQAIMITVLRLYLFISLYQLFGVSTLIGALVGISQTIIQFILLRRDQGLTPSRIEEHYSTSQIIVEDPCRRLRVAVAVFSGILLIY